MFNNLPERLVLAGGPRSDPVDNAANFHKINFFFRDHPDARSPTLQQRAELVDMSV